MCDHFPLLVLVSLSSAVARFHFHPQCDGRKEPYSSLYPMNTDPESCINALSLSRFLAIYGGVPWQSDSTVFESRVNNTT